MSLCENCGSDTKEIGKRRRKFCSNKCRMIRYNEKVGFKGSGLPNGTTGAISELRVCADLLRRGYDVFRAVSPSCSCDIAILKNGQLRRVEVRTAYLNKISGKITHTKTSPERFDIYAAVIEDRIIYTPPL